MHGTHALKGCRLLWRKFPEESPLLWCAFCLHNVGQLSLQLRVMQVIERIKAEVDSFGDRLACSLWCRFLVCGSLDDFPNLELLAL
jgi:hypothetical protein